MSWLYGKKAEYPPVWDTFDQTDTHIFTRTDSRTYIHTEEWTVGYGNEAESETRTREMSVVGESGFHVLLMGDPKYPNYVTLTGWGKTSNRRRARSGPVAMFSSHNTASRIAYTLVGNCTVTCTEQDRNRILRSRDICE